MMKKQTVLEIKRAVKKMDYHPTVATIHSLSDSLLEAIDQLDSSALTEGERHQVSLALMDLRTTMLEGKWFTDRQPTTGSAQTKVFFEKAMFIIDMIAEMLASNTTKWKKEWKYYQPRIKEEFDA